ncbi:MAG: adenylate kinase [Gammaproteobacteria bacterium]|nr:adenylate kinase [Gammaproteobacteria bacterium]MDP6147364.1 adenylate kinase [Gammaproteobacteria bacterium]HJL80466.1 adenylate kinase [Gammaproteobacteria bacterium]HJM09404.1 adenylate kinase [Gammaproteobacteria bacterium]HJN00753.1 adenylate kinase [Gammaproteobacteria bacterium]
MRLILMGAPGSGKGTQAEKLMDEYDCRQISTGVLLRQAIESGSDLGNKVQKIMSEGLLVSDEIVLDLIKNELSGIGESSFLLDGYPRNINQAQSLRDFLENIDKPLDFSILIDVPSEILIKRLSGRRTCSLTGKTLNVYFSSQSDLDECLSSGGELVQREDDNEESIIKRIEVYEQQTEPMINFYRSAGLLLTIDGQGSVDDVYLRLKKLMEL